MSSFYKGSYLLVLNYVLSDFGGLTEAILSRDIKKLLTPLLKSNPSIKCNSYKLLIYLLVFLVIFMPTIAFGVLAFLHLFSIWSSSSWSNVSITLAANVLVFPTYGLNRIFWSNIGGIKWMWCSYFPRGKCQNNCCVNSLRIQCYLRL